MPAISKKQIGAATAAALVVAVPFIKGWEGRNLVAKHFAIDPPGVITVCDGVTNYDIPTLKAGDRYTDEQCDELLEAHLLRYTATIDGCVRPDIPTNTRAALYSAAWNLGAGRICQSSIVRKINAGDIAGGCDALLQYVKANGTFLQGLLNRRRAERKMCASW